MSYLLAAPEFLSSAASDLAGIGSALTAANSAAAAPTAEVLAADEVSAASAAVFSAHASDYQALAGRAAVFDEQFVRNLTANAGSYATAEASNAALLQPLTASAGSFTSVIATLQGQILNFLNSAHAAFGQLLNSLTGFLGPLILDVLAFFAVLSVVIVQIARQALNLLVLI